MIISGNISIIYHFYSIYYIYSELTDNIYIYIRVGLFIAYID